jgi:hypothetical protein
LRHDAAVLVRPLLVAASVTLVACSIDASGLGETFILRDVESGAADVAIEDTTLPVNDVAVDDVAVGDVASDEGLEDIAAEVEPPDTGVIDTGDPDTSLPGCTILERGGHQYSFCEQSANWDQARTRCQTAGADLVVLNDRSELDWVAAQISKMSKGQWHIGLTDRSAEGSFVWIDGSKPSFTNWGFLQPDNFLFSEDCVVMGKDAKWNDVNCTNGPTEAFICETK